MNTQRLVARLSDADVVRTLGELVARDRRTTAELIECLAEVEARRLYVPAGYASMYEYCVGRWGMSEDCAYKRIRAARAAREYPALLPALAEGRLNLGAIVALAACLRPENAGELIAAAEGRTTREVEQLLRERFARPTVVAQPLVPAPAGENADAALRQLATWPVGMTTPEQVAAASLPPAPPVRAFHVPAVPESAHTKFEYLRALLGHAVPTGDRAQVLERALDIAIAQVERARFAQGAVPRPARRSANVRHIAAAVRREVFRRDGGRCTFVGGTGHRCDSRTRLEYDHVVPIAKGGDSRVANLRLRCRVHNQFAAEREFGVGFMQAKRAAARARAEEERVRRQVVHQAAAAAKAGEQAAAAACKAAVEEVIPALRNLGCTLAEARQAAAVCETIPDAPIEERLRLVLRSVAPRGTRTVPPADCSRGRHSNGPS